ncbi:MAG TPA: YraN family protein [Chloroflexota bacterium]|nr:YraN family protein [Chloroflexota bacterium]
MRLDRQTVGWYGERLAEHHLVELGAHLLTRNFRMPFAEIDLVFMHEGDLVAVEVKTRTALDVEKPEEAVHGWKLRRIVQALTTYAVDADLLELPWRIDVVAIDLDLDGKVLRLEHLRSVYPA